MTNMAHVRTAYFTLCLKYIIVFFISPHACKEIQIADMGGFYGG